MKRDRDYAMSSRVKPRKNEQRKGDISQTMRQRLARTRAEAMLLRGPPGNNSSVVRDIIDDPSVMTPLLRGHEHPAPRVLYDARVSSWMDREQVEDRTARQLQTLSSRRPREADEPQRLESRRARELQSLYDPDGMDWEPLGDGGFAWSPVSPD